MADSWFVDPVSNTKVLPLEGGHWIEVKKRLTLGEERASFQSVIGEVNNEGWRRPNLEMQGIAEVAAYIVNWSLTHNGQPVPVNNDGLKIAALRSMRPDRYKVIEEVVQAHIAEMEKELAAEKNVQGGNKESIPTSSSAA